MSRFKNQNFHWVIISSHGFLLLKILELLVVHHPVRLHQSGFICFVNWIICRELRINNKAHVFNELQKIKRVFYTTAVFFFQGILCFIKIDLQHTGLQCQRAERPWSSLGSVYLDQISNPNCFECTSVTKASFFDAWLIQMMGDRINNYMRTSFSMT